MTLASTMRRYERGHINNTLSRRRYDVSRAARDLGISVPTLYRKIDALGIVLPEHGEQGRRKWRRRKKK